MGVENSLRMDAKSGWFRDSDAKIIPNKIHVFNPNTFDLAQLSLKEYPKWPTASPKLHRAKRQNTADLIKVRIISGPEDF